MPPQAIGKNINSERLASSNSLTQAALRMFYGNVERLKLLMGTLFSSTHKHPSIETATLTFSKCLTQYDLHQLLPFLKPDVVPGLMQCAYHVPEEWFDQDRISRLTAAGPESNLKSTTGPVAGGSNVSSERLAGRDSVKANSSAA